MSKQALEGTRLNAFAMNPNDLIVVGFDTDDGPGHPLYDARVKLLPRMVDGKWPKLNEKQESMVQSIMEEGVLQEVHVRKNGDKPEVVWGRHRTIFARIANSRLEAGADPITIRVAAPDKISDGAVLSRSIIENELRFDDDYATRAEKCIRLKEVNGWDDKRIAVRFGVSTQAIRNWLSWHDLAPAVQKALASGAIAASVGMTLAKLERKEQVARLETILAEAAANPGVKPTAAAAKAAGRTEDQAGAGISKGMLKRILKHKKAADLSDDTRNALRWLVGDLSAAKVAGLTAIINAVQADKAARAQRKADRLAKGLEQAPEDAAEEAADAEEEDTSGKGLGPQKRAAK